MKIVCEVNQYNVTWEKFQRYFKEKYLTKRFYNEKAKYFHDLQLGHLSMDEFITKFTPLMRCVPYIWEEREKVQRFISNLPLFMKEHLEFDNPKTMDEVIRKPHLCYQQNRQKRDGGKRWNGKKGVNLYKLLNYVTFFSSFFERGSPCLEYPTFLM